VPAGAAGLAPPAGPAVEKGRRRSRCESGALIRPGGRRGRQQPAGDRQGLRATRRARGGVVRRARDPPHYEEASAAHGCRHVLGVQPPARAVELPAVGSAGPPRAHGVGTFSPGEVERRRTVVRRHGPAAGVARDDGQRESDAQITVVRGDHGRDAT
jgi:hypothetical protein